MRHKPCMTALSDTDQLLPALLDASLKDFPNLPAGVRPSAARSRVDLAGPP